MKKINYLVLMAAMLLVGTNAWAKTITLGNSAEATVNYETLGAAFAAAENGDVIKLVTNLNDGSPAWFGEPSATAGSSRSITLDLNGKTYTYTGSTGVGISLTRGKLEITSSNGVGTMTTAVAADLIRVYGTYQKINAKTSTPFAHLVVSENVQLVCTNTGANAVTVDVMREDQKSKMGKSTYPLDYVCDFYHEISGSRHGVANGVRLDIYGTLISKKYALKVNGMVRLGKEFLDSDGNPITTKDGKSVANPYYYSVPKSNPVVYFEPKRNGGKNDGSYTITTDDGDYSPYVHIASSAQLKTTNLTSTGAIAAYSAGYARWLIEGYCEGSTGVYVKSGEVILNNAEVVSNYTGDYQSADKDRRSGADAGGSGIVMESSANYAGNIDVTVQGDTKVEGSTGYAIDEAVTAVDNKTNVDALTITGGTFGTGAEGQGAIKVTETTASAAADPGQTTTITISGGSIEEVDSEDNKIGDQTLADYLSDAGDTHVTIVENSDGSTTLVVSEGAEEPVNYTKIAGHEDGASVNWKRTGGSTASMSETIEENVNLSELVINQTKYDQTVTIAEGYTLSVGRVILGPRAQIIVQPGAMFKVTGKQGIVAKSASNIILESNATRQATFLFDPDVTSNRNPNAIVRLTTDCKQTHKSPWEYVYQRFAIPVMEGVAPTNNFDPATHGLFPGQAVFETYGWRWTGTKWTTISSWASLKPFTGYQLANSSANGGVQYTFQGELVGNTNGVYDFNKSVGFYFFGNSYTAAMDIETLLLGFKANTPGMEVTVWPYVESALNWKAVTLDDIEDGLAAATYINSMDGFILKLNSGTSNPTVNYADAIWGNPIYAGGSTAPARARSLVDNSVVITVAAAGSEVEDQVTIVERADRTAAFENGADASKYMNPETMNIYADAPAGMLSRVATNNIVGTQISFQAANAEVYTLTLSHVNGSDYAIRDNVTGAMINLSEGTTYTFRQDANSTVNGRFEIVGLAKVPTAIENAEVATSGKGIYTALGQYVGEKDAWSALPAGVYIVDGVKMVK